MNSFLTDEFFACYRRLPLHVRQNARKAYRLWKADHSHPGIQYKKVHAKDPIYSVRVGIGWRALGILKGDTIAWFWIGSHADYEKLLAAL